MGIVKRVQKAAQEKKQEFGGSNEFSDLQDFYNEMQRLGFVKKQEYNLPPLDTIGRRLCNLDLNKK
jgi:hypothetical protein